MAVLLASLYVNSRTSLMNRCGNSHGIKLMQVMMVMMTMVLKLLDHLLTKVRGLVHSFVPCSLGDDDTRHNIPCGTVIV